MYELKTYYLSLIQTLSMHKVLKFIHLFKFMILKKIYNFLMDYQNIILDEYTLYYHLIEFTVITVNYYLHMHDYFMSDVHQRLRQAPAGGPQLPDWSV